MKSREILPVEKRLNNGRYTVAFGKFAYYGLVKTLEEYHKALEAAEKELEEANDKIESMRK